jgi:hypothetical protein
VDSPDHRQQATKCEEALKLFTPQGTRYAISSSQIAPFLKKTRSPAVDPEDFAVVLVLNSNGGHRWGVKPWEAWYFDAPYALILEHKSISIAILGFEVSMDQVITVKQIQGAHLTATNPAASKEKIEMVQSAAKAVLPALRWEKLLLELICDWAFSNGFNEVRVQSAKKSRWYNTFAPKEQAEKNLRLHVRYDVTPLRMGFVPAADGGYTFRRKPD